MRDTQLLKRADAKSEMYRIMVQLGITYGVALGRAVVSVFLATFSRPAYAAQFNAWRATSAATAGGSTVAGSSSVSVSVTEAAQILNVAERATAEEVNKVRAWE